MKKSILKTTALAGVLVMAGAATSGCATKGFVRDQVAVVDGRVTTVEGTAGEALSRAKAAHKLAEGKFHYQVVLSDDSV
ncbi:MAG: OmpA family protein, partial [Phenylobacterium sp.]|nr:OmpA family protein [Phenylobacterium sp.]